jgi:hypothetical protein
MRSWHGMERKENDHFFTPPQSPLKEDTNCNVMLSTQPQFGVNGVVHFVIVEELTNL